MASTSVDADKISFRALKSHDLRLLQFWYRNKLVLKWYAKEARTFEEIEQKYLSYIEGRKKTKPFLILWNEKPIGYIQTYRISDHSDWNAFIGADQGAAGLDLFIGESDFQGRGIGTEAIRGFLSQIVFKDESIVECIVGPDPKNKRSIKAFEKAGFVYWKTIQNKDTGSQEYLMRMYR